MPPNDTGRFTVPKARSDEYLSKVSTLRNIVLTALAPRRAIRQQRWGQIVINPEPSCLQRGRPLTVR